MARPAPRTAALTPSISSNLKTRLSNAERFPCTAPTINMDQHPELMDFLPKDYQYHVCRYTAVSQPDSDHTSFEATVRMSLQTKEEILVWLKCMAVTWRVAYTRPTKGQKIIFKADYRCQHNTKPRETTPKTGRVSKNTDCPAKLKVTLVRTEVSHGQRSRSTDPHIPNYPTLVDISNIHNHNIHVADAVLECAEIEDADQSWCGQTIAAIEELDSTETSEVVQDSEQWDSMIKEFSAMVQSNEGFQGAASAFIKTFHRLKGNPSMLQSAMRMFGRYDGSSLVSKRALQRAANCAGSSIATQPSSVTRRKVKLGGRRRVTAGRPTKNVATMDHRYSYPKGGQSDTDSLPQQ
ncbi:uncharacterized protein LOC133994660 isoform X2 [Scomber scombrus]|uniref:uncharacterized protein LOC133994660 isoform X2 n=1 Tax=Scomber scombrus TaxID=13677 RepID=UPI002DD8258C|nr:uncharacterized protein LOC133994660 isoform X2 [Scomber scombrus]